MSFQPLSVDVSFSWQHYCLASLFLGTFFSWHSLLFTPHSLDTVFSWHHVSCILLFSQLFSLRPLSVKLLSMETFCLDISFVLRWFCILMLFFWLSQYFFVLITRLPQGTSQYYLVLHALHKALPSATLYYKTCTKFPAPLCSTKTCTKYFPLLLFTERLVQSRFQYYFVLQDLHKVLPGTILYSKAGTELLHTASFYTEKLLHTHTHGGFYTEKLLHREAFT